MVRKKSRVMEPEEAESAAGYYKLNTKAVDDLVGASAENTPVFSEEDLGKYRGRHVRLHLSETVKVLLVKAWFAGSVCFFVFWGLGAYVADILDLLLIFGLALGVVTDLLTNNALRFIEKSDGANDNWIMFPRKRFATFFFNILYALFLLFCVYMWYGLINTVLAGALGVREPTPLGVGPILFGVFYACFDMLYVRIRLMFRRIVADAKTGARS